MIGISFYAIINNRMEEQDLHEELMIAMLKYTMAVKHCKKSPSIRRMLKVWQCLRKIKEIVSVHMKELQIARFKFTEIRREEIAKQKQNKRKNV